MNHELPIKLLVGTHNPGKVLEIKQMLTDLPFELGSVSDFPGLPEVQETGRTYEENSTLKAMTYARLCRQLTLADDSGLEVDALGGQPGVLSARFGGASASDEDRTEKLLSAIKCTETQTARFVCCLTLVGWSNREDSGESEPTILNVSRGELSGEIASSPRGENGFGYDPVFIPSGYTLTLAELPIAIKNRISHRARALSHMRAFLEGWRRPT